MRPTDEEESCVVSGTDGGVLLQHQILKTEGGVRHWPVLGNQRMKVRFESRTTIMSRMDGSR